MVTTGERGSALDKLPSSSSAPGYRFSPLIASRNSLKSSDFDISQKSPFLCSILAPQIQLIVSNVLTLNDDILLPQVVSTPRSKVWRRKVDLTPSQPPSQPPFIRDLACHIAIQPIGWEGHEIGNLTEEDNVQNNVAVKMKFDQRFNVTNVNDRTMLVFVGGALECRGEIEGLVLDFCSSW